jgi:hypothetical protein
MNQEFHDSASFLSTDGYIPLGTHLTRSQLDHVLRELHPLEGKAREVFKLIINVSSTQRSQKKDTFSCFSKQNNVRLYSFSSASLTITHYFGGGGGTVLVGKDIEERWPNLFLISYQREDLPCNIFHEVSSHSNT